MSNLAILEVADGVATLRLQRPPLNVLDEALQRAIIEVAAEAQSRSDVRAVIIYGSERAFSAGGDLAQMAGLDRSQMDTGYSQLLQGFANAVAAISKPTIAAIAGHALGGGCELALAADIRIASSDARIGLPEIALGVIPGAGGTQRLARLVGPSTAKRLIFTSTILTAREALAIGLVDEVCEPGEVLEVARTLAARLAAGPQLALAAAKRAIDGGMDVPLAAAIEGERREFVALFDSPDRSIGMTAFLQKVPAQFTGTRGTGQ